MKHLLFLFLLTPFLSFAQSPGGISTNLQVWLRADSNGTTTTNGATLTTWTNKAGTGNFGNNGTPTYQNNADNLVNYNPVIKFDGGEYLTNSLTNFSLTTKAASIFAVATKLSSTTDNSFFGPINNLTPFTQNALQLSTNEPLGSFKMKNYSATTDYFLIPYKRDQPNIFAGRRTNNVAGDTWSSLNGNTASQTAYATNYSSTCLYGVGVHGSNGTLTGNMSELIVYNGYLDNGEMKTISSYLAIKYGITLDGTGSIANGDYKSSSSIIIWAQHDGVLHNRIIGIGRDDASGLRQKQSHTLDDSARIYLASLTVTNQSNSGSFSADEQFLMMGDNNADSRFNGGNTEYPGGNGYTHRLDREWKLTNTAYGAGFKIDLTVSGIGVNEREFYTLLVDDDSTFSSGAMAYNGVITRAGSTLTITVSNSQFPANSTKFFTIAKTIPGPGGVGLGLNFWLRADSATSTTTNNAALSAWQNYSNDTTVFSQSTGESQPVFRHNATDDINYNPVVFFDGTNDFLQTTKGSISPSASTLVSVVSIPASGSYREMVSSGGSVIHQGIEWHITAENKLEYREEVGDGNMEVLAESTTNEPESVKLFATTATAVANGVKLYANAKLLVQGGVTLDPVITDTISIGGNVLHENNENWLGRMAEVIGYDKELNAGDLLKVESYLGIKYGITFDNTGGGANGDYISSGSVIVWDASDSAAYHNQVIGIGRDDKSTLLQKQSHTSDDVMRIYISSLSSGRNRQSSRLLTSGNDANTGEFNSDSSFVMVGHNDGQLFSTGSTEHPEGITSRLDREWKITNTNMNEPISLDFKLDAGVIDPADLRLLVDDDGNLEDATVFTPDFSVADDVVTVSNITTAMIPVNDTRFFTIASARTTTTLPVTFANFIAQPQPTTVLLSWQTLLEQRNVSFAIERSANGRYWQQVGLVPGAGNSTQLLNYAFTDQQPLNGTSYYRLKQTDVDGTYTYSPTRMVKMQYNESGSFIYPNPVFTELVVKGSNEDLKELKILNALGQDLTHLVQVTRSAETQSVVDMTALAAGIYIVKTKSRSFKVLKK